MTELAMWQQKMQIDGQTAFRLYIVGNLKKKNRNYQQVPKQDEDTGNLQILLHLRSYLTFLK